MAPGVRLSHQPGLLRASGPHHQVAGKVVLTLGGDHVPRPAWLWADGGLGGGHTL